MEVQELSKLVNSIVVVSGTSGESTRIFSKKRKKRKRSKHLRGHEKLTRKILDASVISSRELRDRHERSSRKKRDGWLRDLGKNMYKAHKKGSKKLRIRL